MSSNSYICKENNKLHEKKEVITKYTKKYLDKIRETDVIHPIKQKIRIQKLLQHFGLYYGYLD